MLQKLTVKNYAIIDHIEIDFSEQLNIITGETGAGKSILLGALSLVLGDRADSRSLFDEQEKCVVEAQFQIGGYGLATFFSDNDLDYETTTFIRREITNTGKSRAFINDTPVNLNVLRELGAQLVNLHSQHETLELSSAGFQLQLVDAVAKNDAEVLAYSNAYKVWREQLKELETLKAELLQTTGDLDYLTYQLQELDEAGLDNEDHQALEQELVALENAEEIKGGLSKVYGLLNDDEAATSMITEASYQLGHLLKFSAEIAKLDERLESVLIELQDIARETLNLAENTTYDQERVALLNDRLNVVNKLLSKHRLGDVSELVTLRNDLRSRIDASANLQERINQLELDLVDLKHQLQQTGLKLSQSRKAVVTVIGDKVAEQLAYVGMPNSKLAIEIEQTTLDKATPQGLDKVRFLFSANKGRQPEELKHVASGGELSRLMLVLKSLIAANTALPTLIFDEIDTGISGEVANKVGHVLEQLGKSHQIISITHLPQIASKGNSHYFVYKAQAGSKTVTRIKELNKEERVAEIAKMLGGERITDAALENAKELLGV